RGGLLGKPRPRPPPPAAGPGRGRHRHHGPPLRGAGALHTLTAARQRRTRAPSRIRGTMLDSVTQMRISEAAQRLGVSPDTVRRAVGAGRLAAGQDAGGRTVVEAVDVARMAGEQASAAQMGTVGTSSPRNQMRGIVTRIVSDRVM